MYILFLICVSVCISEYLYFLIVDIVLERSFESVILLEGTQITLSCLPTLFPEVVPLNWTHNGILINENTSGIAFTPEGLNHNLTIESPVTADSGVYRCIAAPTVNQTINVTVLESKKRVN